MRVLLNWFMELLILDCPDLSDDNGEFSYSNEQFLNSTATLNCNNGYREIDSPATCLTSGWSTTPSCTSKYSV